MDHLWTPWRYQYVTASHSGSACVFCDLAASKDDAEALIVHRAKFNFVVLNRFPYSSGHLMIVPYQHVDLLEKATDDTLQEMMSLARNSQRHLREVYKPGGFNLGMNLGECAGAGIAGHIHMHVLPRWSGDTSFITTVSETRILPEDLGVSWRKLSDAFRQE